MVCGVWCVVCSAAAAVRGGRGAALGRGRPLPLHDRRLLVERRGNAAPAARLAFTSTFNTGVYSFLNIRRRTRDASGIAFYYIKKSLETLL